MGDTQPDAPVEKKRKPGTFAPGHDPRRSDNAVGKGGRPKSAIRAACREAYEKRLPILEGIADGVPLVHTRRYLRRNLPTMLQVYDLNPMGDPNEYIEIQYEESASPQLRKETVELLGKMGGVNVPGEEDGDERMKDFVFQLSFD